MGDKIGRHTKRNVKGERTERPNTRVLAKSRFESVGTTTQLMELLFGPG